MSKKKRFLYKQGSTVTEVVISLSILATFVTGAAKVNMATYQVAKKAGTQYVAANLVKNRIETIRNMRQASYEHITQMEEKNVVVNEDGAEDSSGNFCRTTRIVETAVDDLLEIQVTIKIRNPVTREFGTEQQYLQSYVAKLLDR